MSRAELQRRVAWTVQDAPPEVRAARLLGGVVDAVATVASFGTGTGAPARPTWSLPADPDAYLDLGLVQLRGAAPWLPGGGRHRVQATQRAAYVDDDSGRRPPAPVPLADLHVTGARRRTRARRPRHPDAPWTLVLTGAGTVEVQGAWLALAWLGHLAGWPEPVER